MSLEEKQNFLREKILDKGYDANQFIDFINAKEGKNEVDLNNWSMPDLKLVVNEFIRLNGGKVEEEKKPAPKQEQENQLILKKK